MNWLLHFNLILTTLSYRRALCVCVLGGWGLCVGGAGGNVLDPPLNIIEGDLCWDVPLVAWECFFPDIFSDDTLHIVPVQDLDITIGQDPPALDLHFDLSIRKL